MDFRAEFTALATGYFGDDPEPDTARFIEISGRLLPSGEDADSVGALEAVILRDAWIYEEDELLQVCDAHSGDLSEMFRTVREYLLPLDPPESLFFLTLAGC